MGRKKITITPIKDERTKHVTFNKRKAGLIKKAIELSVLCNSEIVLVMFNSDNQLFEYCSNEDPRYILQKYLHNAHLPHDRLTNKDLSRFDKKSKKSSGKKKDDEKKDSDSEEDETEQNQTQPQEKQTFVTELSLQEQFQQQGGTFGTEYMNRVFISNQQLNSKLLPKTVVKPEPKKRETQDKQTTPQKKMKYGGLSIEVPQNSTIPLVHVSENLKQNPSIILPDNETPKENTKHRKSE